MLGVWSSQICYSDFKEGEAEGEAPDFRDLFWRDAVQRKWLKAEVVLNLSTQTPLRAEQQRARGFHRPAQALKWHRMLQKGKHPPV